MALTIVTLNLLSGGSDWTQRLPLIVAGLKSLSPDVIAVQEVSLPAGEADGEAAGGATGDTADKNPAEQIAAGLGYAHVSLGQKTSKRRTEAVALISRLPLLEPECLPLGGQNRVAQRAIIQVEGRNVTVANVHLFWQPGDSRERLRQVERLIDWLGSVPGDVGSGSLPAIVCGDFNGTPETRAIRRMRAEYVSAYAAVHGREPERTFPTPLKRSWLEVFFGIFDLLIYLRPQHITLGLASTLDYIFVDPRLSVARCERVLDRPAHNDPQLYPSDHYGLLAEVEVAKT